MVSKDIVNYVKTQFQKGQDAEEIKNALISAGWQMADIEEAFHLTGHNASIPFIPDSSPYSYQYSQINKIPTSLSSATDFLKEAWRVYMARYKTYLGIILIPIIAIVAFIGVAVAGVPDFDFLNSPLRIFFAISLVFVVFMFQYWGQASLIYAIKDNEERIGIIESYRRGWRKIGPIFWVGLLSGIIIFGGYLLLLVPGIIFGIWFSFAVVIAVAENIGGMDAILKSKFYVTGYWWEVLWRLVFIALILGGISFIFALPVWIISFMSGTGLVKGASLPVIKLIFNLLGSVIGFFLAPLSAIYTFLVYKNLRAIKGEKSPIFSAGEKTKFILAGIFGVLLFIGLIATPIILISSSLGNARNRAMEASRQADISQLRVSLEMYALDHDDKYPEKLDQLLEKSESLNLSAIPIDPKTNMRYEYRWLNNGKDYELCMRLDLGGKKCFRHL